MSGKKEAMRLKKEANTSRIAKSAIYYGCIVKVS
jgi:hypothetical protein